MLNKIHCVYDIECDALLDKVTKIHCLSYRYKNEFGVVVTKSLINYDDIKNFFLREDILRVGHNIILFDERVIYKILGILPSEELADTLALSWTLNPTRKQHSLESFDSSKVQIDDWQNLSTEQYVERCEKDVYINYNLWVDLLKYLNILYDNNEDEIVRYINYLNFKLFCVREQEEEGIGLDEEYCTRIMMQLQEEEQRKKEELKGAMPKVPVYKKTVVKNAVYEDDGNFFRKGELFFDVVKQEGKKMEAQKEVKKLKGWKKPNPNSTPQIKSWLYSLGWVPEHIKHVRNKKTGDIKKIPQIASEKGGGEICKSVKKLFEKEPKLSILEGLTVVSHRITIFKGFLRDAKEGKLHQTIKGLTNTLRLRHAVIVNLPGGAKKYAEQVRSCLIPFEGYTLCGADLSNIEDRTKRHYIYVYDPDYVNEMSAPGFDAHLDIGKLAKLITPKQEEYYKWYESKKEADRSWKPTPEEKKKFEEIKAQRHKAKTTNFSSTYKVGAETLARGLNSTVKEAKKILEVFWERNKAILQVEAALEVKTIQGQKWIKNPVSKFWYSLRNDKDKFSTLNQGTAVYVFDSWVYFIRQNGRKLNMQSHDEWVANVLIGRENEMEAEVADAMQKVNEKLKLNVELGCSMSFGPNYWAVH